MMMITMIMKSNNYICNIFIIAMNESFGSVTICSETQYANRSVGL